MVRCCLEWRKEGKLVSVLGINLALFLFLSIACIDFAQCSQLAPPSSVTGLGKGASSSGGKDSSSSRSGASPSSTNDGESSHRHHNHNYLRHHRHSPPHPHHTASGKSAPSSLYPSSSSVYAGYPDYVGSAPVSYSNPADAYYEPRYYERPSREFSARSTSYPAMVAAASSTSQVGFDADTEYGGLALATGHHGGGHHGGHGQSHGHGGHDGGYGGHTTYYKTVNKLDQSSLGLLGLLGLLSLLSNVLLLLTTTATTTTAAGRRKKRDTMMLVNFKEPTSEEPSRRNLIERLGHLILPSLNVVGHAKDGRIPLNCTYQEVCKTNRVLVQVFGADEGRPVSSVMTTAITKLLATDNKSSLKGIKNNNNHRYPARNETRAPLLLLEKILKQAALAGRNGQDCEIAYPTCEALTVVDDDHQHNLLHPKNSMEGSSKGGFVRLPFLISPERASAIILGGQP